jgi:hypothetical protein
MKGEDISFACRCGVVKGVCRDTGGAMGVRVVCYCADCQAFAAFLGAERDYLDAAGGTDIYQTSPSRLEINAGLDRLKAVIVAPKGLHRFYADCCKTPIANAIPGRKLPFSGTFVRTYDAKSRERVFRAPIAAVFVERAHGEPVETARTALPLLILDLMRRAAAEWISGRSRRNIFLDAVDEGRIPAPHVVSAEERTQLDAKAAAHAKGARRA